MKRRTHEEEEVRGVNHVNLKLNKLSAEGERNAAPG